MSFIYEITNPDGETGSLNPDFSDKVIKKINDTNEAVLNFSSMGKIRRGLVKNKSIITCKDEKGFIYYKGVVVNYSTLDAGGISIETKCIIAFKLSKDVGEYVNSPYKNEPSENILTDIITESGIGIGTIESGINLSMRFNGTENYKQAIYQIIQKTGQEIKIDYENEEISILNHKGSEISVMTLNDKRQIENVKNNPNIAPANKVKVFGAMDGDYQIKSVASDIQVGEIPMTKIVIDRSLKTQDECQFVANRILEKEKQEVKIVDFDILNPFLDLNLGDVITINAPEKDIDNEEYRITQIIKGTRNGNDFLSVQVTNKEYSSVIKDTNKILTEFQENNINTNTYSQGSGNTQTYEGMINANNSNPLRVGIYIPEGTLKDEFDNIKKRKFSISYEIEKFRSSVGTSSISNNSTGLDVDNISNSTGLDVDNISNSTGLTADDNPSDLDVDDSVDTATSLQTISNNNYSDYLEVEIPNVSGEIDFVCVNYTIEFLSGADTGLADIQIYNIPYSGSGYDLMLLSNQFIYRPDGKLFLTDAWLQAVGETYYVDYDTSREMTNPTIKSYTIMNGTIKKRDNIRARIYNKMGSSVSICHSLVVSYIKKHQHGIGISESNHNHNTDVSDPQHNHNITIGTGSTDSSSVNANQISSIKLFYWNGSSWILKNEITNTGKILDFNVDISDGGNYPDAEGYWKVELLTNNSSPDLVKAIVNLEHNLKNE